MRRLLKWLLLTLGIAAIVRKLRAKRGRADQQTADATATATEDPADELRRKLADTRESDPGTAPAESATSEASVDERRTEVHDQGRSAIDEMRSSTEDE